MEMIAILTAFYPTAGHNRLRVAQIRACAVQSNRVKGGQHSYIRDNRNIILRMTVAERRHVANQADVEARLIAQDRGGILYHFLVQNLIHLIARSGDRILRTGSDTAAAAHTAVVIDRGLFLRDGDGVMRTIFAAHTAANTKLLVDIRLSCAVHFHFSGAGSASHSDVFEGSAKPGRLMALEMSERDKIIRVHNGMTDLASFT